MKGRLKQPAPRLPRPSEEAARDWLAQAQAAALDEQPGAALRALGRLHELLVPLLDSLLPANEEGGLSSGTGFLGLYRELPDLDFEREPPGALLLFYAASADEPEEDAPLGPARDEAARAAQWAWLEERLRREEVPRPSWWRRLARGAAGGLGDRARLQVQRGATVVLERLPPPPDEAEAALEDGPGLFETDVGELQRGDRLTLQLPAPLPGRIAVLHGAGGVAEAELEVLLPASAAEEAPRRAQEVVEVSGEVAPVEGAEEQCLVVLWAPELLPAAWYRQVAARRRLPPDARLWRYRYRVGG